MFFLSSATLYVWCTFRWCCWCFGCNTNWDDWVAGISQNASNHVNIFCTTDALRLHIPNTPVCMRCVPVQQTLTLFMVFVQRIVEPVCYTDTQPHSTMLNTHTYAHRDRYICMYTQSIHARANVHIYNVSYHTRPDHTIAYRHITRVYSIHIYTETLVWFCISNECGFIQIYESTTISFMAIIALYGESKNKKKSETMEFNGRKNGIYGTKNMYHTKWDEIRATNVCIRLRLIAINANEIASADCKKIAFVFQ